jgi:hypothetical protein
MKKGDYVSTPYGAGFITHEGLGTGNYNWIVEIGGNSSIPYVFRGQDLTLITPASSDLERAALQLYYAGVWSCDRRVDEARLWTQLRDALGLKPGTSPRRAN